MRIESGSKHDDARRQSAAGDGAFDARRSSEPILDVRNLIVRYPARRRQLEAVSGVSFSIRRGETLGLVGESGCGKTSTGMALIHLPPPSAGEVYLDGVDIAGASEAELRPARHRMQPIFQDPVSSLNPIRRVRHVVAEGLKRQGVAQDLIDERTVEMLSFVGLDIDVIGGRRPHELSGGQCQRVAIARALLLRPEVLICDEPVASLDVSVQGQVLNLLDEMRTRLGLAMLFISHDMAVVENVCDRVAVMYLGKIVEIGPTLAVTRSPAHPYTRALISSVPRPDPSLRGKRLVVTGETPSPLEPPAGCRFHTRCPLAEDICRQVEPPLESVDGDTSVACHFPLRGDRPGGRSGERLEHTSLAPATRGAEITTRRNP